MPDHLRSIDLFDFPDDKSYDKNKFYTSTGAAGGSQQLPSTQIDSGLYVTIQRWLDSHTFPRIQTKQDFIRNAVYHAIHYLNEEHPDRPNDLDTRRAFNVYSQIARREERIQESRKSEENIKQLEEACKEFFQRCDWENMAGALKEARDSIDEVPVSFRRRTLDVIERYEELVEGKGFEE